jgi:hypothetical protein
MTYRLTTTWRWETWGASFDVHDKYSRLAARPIDGGSISGTINPFITDIPRGQTFLVNGTTVTVVRTPSQDDIAAADEAYMGGHEYDISDEQAQIFINAGYGDYVTQL